VAARRAGGEGSVHQRKHGGWQSSAAADRMDDLLRPMTPRPRSLITAVAVSVAVRGTKKGSPRSGRPL